MKSIIGKFGVQSDSFPKICTTANEEVTDTKSIDEKLNRFFLKTGTNQLAETAHCATNS